MYAFGAVSFSSELDQLLDKRLSIDSLPVPVQVAVYNAGRRYLAIVGQPKVGEQVDNFGGHAELLPVSIVPWESVMEIVPAVSKCQDRRNVRFRGSDPPETSIFSRVRLPGTIPAIRVLL